jgi:hypothetical protein
MTAQPDRPIVIRLSAQQAEQAELLEGLETWLQLGLLSDEQVRQLCQEHLICALPEPIAAPSSIPESQQTPELPRAQATQPVFTADDSDFADAVSSAAPSAARSRQASRSRRSPHSASSSASSSASGSVSRSASSSPSRIEQWFQAFMAEISVIWLLFLGVFLVVVSSGVLAASQWQNFSPVGQYSILFAYTLAFFVAGFWTGRKESLRLTARMLQITTLLIIPINFWMIDGLQLWQTPVGVITSAIAAFVLTLLLVRLFRTNPTLIPRHSLKLAALNYIVLCWLHWGWAISPVPLIATYIGTVSTAVLMAIQTAITPSVAILSVATLLLIGRATLLAQVPIAQLGLALGLCGWVFCWVTRPHAVLPNAVLPPSPNASPDTSPSAVTGARRDRTLWIFAGVGLMGLGWLVSVAETPPFQAFAVSSLGLWLLFDRLQHSRRGSTLTALLLVGLQAYTLLWRLLPATVQQTIIATGTNLLGNIAMPFVLLGLAFFPYLWFTLALAAHFRPASPPSASPSLLSLPRQAECFAFVLGVAMTLISLLNPGVRSLNLLLSALTLGWTIRQRTRNQAIVPPALIYLAHGAAVAALLSGIDWGFPDLSNVNWTRSLLVVMGAEWLLCMILQNSWWRQSAWHIGLGLAGFSYTLLMPTYIGVVTPAASYQNLVWLAVPILLTVLSRLRRFFAVPLAAWFSTGALGLHLFLIGMLNSWIISLTIATAVMLVNTSTLRHLVAAIVTIGFALALEVVLVWRILSEQLTSAQVIIIAALTLWGLWLLRHWLVRQSTALGNLYTKAIDGWATLLCFLLLGFMPLLSVTTFSLNELPVTALLAAGLTAGAITYRLWQEPTELGFYGLAGAIESLLIMLVIRLGGSWEDWAIGNLGLGLLVQFTADVWVRRTGQPYRASWHRIPLIYAAIGFLAAHYNFTAFTGLYTLAAALVGIGVGRRRTEFRLLTAFSLLFVSIAAYELLLYQLIQAEGGRLGDAIALIAGLAALIGWLYRLLSRWLLPYLRFTPAQLNPIAHLHWAIGSLLALTALTASLSFSGTVLLLSVAVALTAYALSLGRIPSAAASPSHSTPLSQSAQWTYAGITEALMTIAYGLYEAIPDRSLLFGWAGAIASGIAVGMYALPWQRWGWSVRPWRNAAAVFPLLIIALTSFSTAIQSLLITAAFYAWYAKETRQLRLSYLSVGLLDWAVLRVVNEQGWLNFLWLSLVVGGTLLYVAQIDPALQTQSAREQRHFLRSIATGLVCLTALYQAEVDTGGTAIGVGLATLILSIGLIFAGLLLRVRAYLYIGTATFVLRILRWLWLFINNYSLLLWAVGIVLGLIFIWIAATFEARRNQVNAIVQYWSTELEQWE